ncbi:Hexose transporter [Pleurostoma richardsiae]|uniref:Hexose transporter n=1 Tax=Pleurostoma richardsiae TaxID=41990 RepID=A0AA38VQS5_9PEZI|nr:Hexose transporter [Pleurostoma richardsiae]
MASELPAKSEKDNTGGYHHRADSSDSGTKVEHADHTEHAAGGSQPAGDGPAPQPQNMSRKLDNPLAGLSQERLGRMGEEYCQEHGITDEEDIRAFRIGAMIAGNDNQFETIQELREPEREVLQKEITHKWANPSTMYGVIIVCSLCAAVQGMDETVVNGAQIFYERKFNLSNTWLIGLTNGGPYLACAVIGCWLTEPMNHFFGRRGTVFVACVISALACLWQAFTNTWWHMFIARFALGLGIGPKSATTPIFAAECSPPKLRGALVMQWQMWTAFGIMLGYAADLAFYFTPSNINWRLMMGSAMFPAVIVCFLIPFYPESPRWYLTKNRHVDAFKSICRLRYEKVQAARDLFYMWTLLEAEREAMSIGKANRIREMFTIRRNRNAMIASEIVMFMQQFCGVNVIAYYSSQIFLDADLSEVNALAASLGFGVINWLFAIPALYTIDTFGRRNLLLTTFPLMALFLLFTGFSFWIPPSSDAHVACIALGIYLFGMVYSPGEGPVPFTYSAEAYPLYIRPLGMSLATATTWLFNFILSLTWPSLLKAFKPQGAFGWYAAWNVVGFFAVLFFVPETKEKTLEELDGVFGVPLRKLVAYGGAQFSYFWQRYVFRRDVAKPAVPVAEDFEEQERRYLTKEELDAARQV